MPCYHPLAAYQTFLGKIVFKSSGHDILRALRLPCGQCVGCRLSRSAMWALRCVHEAKMYERNCFITLTYNDANLPENGSLRHSDWQLFMKRLRERHRYGGNLEKIRFYMCGEYGESFGRPHYHACLFNFDFDDKVYKRVNSVGDRIYKSSILDDCWGFADPGNCEIGSVSFRSAGYVARYIMKKITGDDAVAHYGDRFPEYTKMSKGIGKAWFEKYSRDVFPSDFMIHDGKRLSVPRYYSSLYELNFPDAFLPIKRARIRKAGNAHLVKPDETYQRLRDREVVTNARLKRLKKGDL